MANYEGMFAAQCSIFISAVQSSAHGGFRAALSLYVSAAQAAQESMLPKHEKKTYLFLDNSWNGDTWSTATHTSIFM